MNSKDGLKQLEQNHAFINTTYKKALLPCMLSILSANINVIVDGILVGQKLGHNALAAINLCMPVNLLLCVIGSFVGAGTAINASKSLGHSSEKKANEYYKAGFLMSYAFSALITIAGVFLLNPICGFLCSDTGVFPYVHAYSLITIIGSIFKIMIYIPFWYLRLDGKNKEVSYIMVVLTVGNIVLDVVFVFGLDKGVFGAGLANVISTAAAFFLGLYYLQKDNSNFTFSYKIDFSQISFKNICLDGLPSSLNNLCCTIRMLIINFMFLSIGGAKLVAIFTAVNGIFCIGECIILGIPQASNAMLGVYEGEHDNNSCRLIIKCELAIGAIYSAIFFVLCCLLSPVVNIIYGLDTSIFIPLVLMSISIFPSLLCNVFSSYYNITGKNSLSSLIIVLRLVVFTYIGLLISVKTSISEFAFYILAEIFTIVSIYIITGIKYKKNKNLDRYMLCDLEADKSGKVLNFSVENSNDKICESSELISEFCGDNGLSIKETMRLQLAIEEALVLISDVNKNENTSLSGFDIRAFLFDHVSGVRIRYDGYDFNPFNDKIDTSEYMGIKMISDMLETTLYRRTFGVNTLILLLKDEDE